MKRKEDHRARIGGVASPKRDPSAPRAAMALITSEAAPRALEPLRKTLPTRHARSRRCTVDCCTERPAARRRLRALPVSLITDLPVEYVVTWRDNPPAELSLDARFLMRLPDGSAIITLFRNLLGLAWGTKTAVSACSNGIVTLLHASEMATLPFFCSLLKDAPLGPGDVGVELVGHDLNVREYGVANVICRSGGIPIDQETMSSGGW
jgi:hypothetical protein